MHCLSAVCSQRSVVCFRLALLTTWSTRCGRRGLNLSSPTVKTFSTRSRTIATGTATRCRRAGQTVGVAAAAVVAAMSAATTTKNLWTASLRPFHSDVGWFWSTFPRAIIPKVRFLTLNPWSLWPDNQQPFGTLGRFYIALASLWNLNGSIEDWIFGHFTVTLREWSAITKVQYLLLTWKPHRILLSLKTPGSLFLTWNFWHNKSIYVGSDVINAAVHKNEFVLCNLHLIICVSKLSLWKDIAVNWSTFFANSDRNLLENPAALN